MHPNLDPQLYGSYELILTMTPTIGCLIFGSPLCHLRSFSPSSVVLRPAGQDVQQTGLAASGRSHEGAAAVLSTEA